MPHNVCRVSKCRVSGCGSHFGAMAGELDACSEPFLVLQGGLRRSERLRNLKENRTKVFSRYFTEPTQRLSQIRRFDKKGLGKRKRAQSRCVHTFFFLVTGVKDRPLSYKSFMKHMDSNVTYHPSHTLHMECKPLKTEH